MRRRALLFASLLIALGAVHAVADPDAAGGIAYLAQSGGYWQVWTLDPGRGRARQVTHSPYEKTRFSWFPDGRHLLVNGLDGRVFRVTLEDGSESALDLPLSGFTDAVLSPDGTRIAFSLGTAGGVDANEIWVVDLDGSNLRQLTRMPWLQHDPQWSADGVWIYFLSGDGGQAHDIWRVSADGARREQITVASLYHFDLALAPDLRLAFSSNRTGNYEIFSLDAAQRVERWTDDPAFDGHPSWSPDGKSLVFHSTRSGTLNLWRIAAPGATPEQLTDHAGGARSPVWWHPASAS